MTRLPVLCLVFLTHVSWISAQQTEDQTKRLTVYPASAPTPAFRYGLLPGLAVQSHGDAAPHYRKASKLLADLVPREKRSEWDEKLYRYRTIQFTQFPREEARAFLKPLGELLSAIDSGARSEFCNWDLTPRLRQTGMWTSLAEFQDCREFGQLLALRSRLELADGRIER